MRQRVRLTRRGRNLLFALVVGLVLPIIGIAASADASDGDAGAGVEVVVHTVGPGETLWQLAQKVTPVGKDVRDTVREVQRLHELASTQLQVGQTVLVPLTR
jgi:LysM repeat protein